MEIQRADPALRRLAIIVAVLTLSVGAAAIFALELWFADVRRLAGADVETLKDLVAAVFAWSLGGTCALLVALSVYLWRFGRRIQQASRYPPPGIRVARDTAVLHGIAAARRGTVLRALAGALLVCVIGLLVAVWRLRSLLV